MIKIISSIFFISCTSIGAGILALPCLTVYNGFFYSTMVFIICYIFMTISAFLMLETTLWFKKNTNIISVINQILGYKWKVIASIIYISLLYSLISAYILAYTKWMMSNDLSNKYTLIPSLLIYIVLIYLITFHKNEMFKKINNILSILLFLTYTIIIFKCLNYVKMDNIKTYNLENISNIFTLAITSFGFAIIIPTLSDFLKKKNKILYKTILLGSLIPLIIYILWILIMLGVFPLSGEFSLQYITQQKIPADVIFTNFISKIINSESIIKIIKIFSFLAVITSLIGVATSLKDFLSDERILKKNNIIILIAIIIPPILAIIYLKLGFIALLKLSGILVSFLLGIIPTITVWYGRYILKIKGKITIPGGKFLLTMNCSFFLYAIINDIFKL
ncbi:aromatic amino acid transport family protein [Candidatus Azoamicus ciliaticola]|uniref:Tyrosine-specific transport protein n=1 Tax=Candidatus Azoamicus ciliaticola TaxID=2652803 RepID=A0A6J5JYZ2_9GAMM|nr:aromatic amino acid transport family protein [Candidatus Azoamicus ciliaticola]CAB3976230.1 Tyrosine-specific transport protein [Candidatus Azoamicus ciliaticola]